MAGHKSYALGQQGRKTALTAILQGLAHGITANGDNTVNVDDKRYWLKVYTKSKPYYWKEKGEYYQGVDREKLEKAHDMEVTYNLPCFVLIVDVKRGEIFGQPLQTLFERGTDFTHGGRRILLLEDWLYKHRVYTLSTVERKTLFDLAVENQKKDPSQGSLF